MKSFQMGDCRICRGISKTKCIFCGQKRPRKKDMTPMERLRLEGFEECVKDLRVMYTKLKNTNMASTGHFDTDEAIRKEIGDWGPLSRGTVEVVDGTIYTVRLDSGVVFKVDAPHREAVVGQRMTVRFFGSRPAL